MASRSQMRLAQLTGSLDSGLARTSALSADSLQGVMDHMASAIKRLTGYSDFHSNHVGSITQNLDITGSLDVSANAVIDGDLSAAGFVDFTKTGGALGSAAFDVAGFAEFADVVHATGNMITLAEFQGDLQYSASAGTGISMSDFYNNANVDIAVDTAWLRGTGISVNDTNSIDMTMSAGGVIEADLILSGGAANDALEITADGLDLKSTIARNRTFSDDVTVSGKLTVGADLEVNGTLTYINTTNLEVTDKKVVIADGATTAVARDGAGIYIGDDANANYAIFWDEASGQTRWKANDQFHAPILQSDVASALYLRSDADGDIQAGNAADLVDGIKAQFTGSNIAVSDNGSGLITHSISAGTGVSVANAVIAIGQPVATTDSVTFAGITDSSLTPLRLVGSNASSELVSTALTNYIAGTTHQVIVTGDGSGGVTLSLPQNIHSGSSPTFAGVNLEDSSGSGVGAMYDAGAFNAADAGKLKIFADSDMLLEDGNKSGSGWGSELQLSDAGDWADYKAAYGEKSLMAAIVAAGQGDQYAGKFHYSGFNAVAVAANNAGTWSLADFTDYAGNTSVLDANLSGWAAADVKKRVDVYVNGQLMQEGASADYEVITTVSSEAIDFKFDIEVDDVLHVIVR